MDKIQFIVNGEEITLSGADVTPTTSLNDYLRKNLNLTGTKAMCHEGGCGVCVVSVTRKNILTKEKEILSVNSCLVHVLSCHQWEITTIEGVCNPVSKEYHPLQRRLALFNGTQCGYCSPGWVMSMYSMYANSQLNLSMAEVENSFGGNLCRCTGYRPILDAFKTFTSDVNDELKKKVADLEDLDQALCPCYRVSAPRPRTPQFDAAFSASASAQARKQLDVAHTRWYKAFTAEEVFQILKENTQPYRLVAGNTGNGVYHVTEEPRVVIDISSVEELSRVAAGAGGALALGAGLSVADAARALRVLARRDQFHYLRDFYRHLKLVAHVPVRNVGTLAGNLALKHQHHEFPSDIHLMLETVDAQVVLMGPDLCKTPFAMDKFLEEDLRNRLIHSVRLPPLGPEFLLRTYKIMPRAQNAHAIVNAGFLFQVDRVDEVVAARLVFGNIRADCSRARHTELLLTGLDLFSNAALQTGLASLNTELAPAEVLPEPSALCRKTIALGLFYKALLSLAPGVSPRYRSGGELIQRELSSGAQSFDTDKKLYPLNAPVCKLEGLKQCAGELRYTCDSRGDPRELFLAFVTSTICVGAIADINPEAALAMPGVIAFYKADDIPGKNTFTPLDVPGLEFEEEILASYKICYYGQPLGIVAASDQKTAWRAAKRVAVRYHKSSAAPVLTVRDALGAPDKARRVREEATLHHQEAGSNDRYEFSGSFHVPSQFHFSMERQCARVTVSGDSVVVTASTQWPDLVHVAVAQALAIPENKVEVFVRGVGGAYGGKASRSALVATAAAVVARLQDKPASITLSIEDDMQVMGKRMACDVDYKGTVSSSGHIQQLNITYYSDCGYNFNDTAAPEVLPALTNLYDKRRWKVTGYSVLTDKASNTWCRAPSTTEGTAIMEHIMEHIAAVTNNDPIDVRLANLAPEHESMHELIATFKSDSHYAALKDEIDKYNADNAWRKRGISLAIMSYPITYSGNYSVTISVYHADGSIMIGHGGIEMGQGINTKVAQVCAFKLKLPLEKVAVRGYCSFVAPNAMASNGSITSESVAFACLKACDVLLERLRPVRAQMNAPSWEEVVKEAYLRGVSLQATYMMSEEDRLEEYSVYGVASCEVELDCLTGQTNVRRAHILEDTGVSMSPEVDVGQIEGAFTMGLGLWTSERLAYDAAGRLATDRTWTYKPPGARDIPAHFAVAFVRNSVNKAGVLRSKATGEPALTLAVVVVQALHQAILEARKEHGYEDRGWLHVDTPYNTENILKAISPKIESYKLTAEVTGIYDLPEKSAHNLPGKSTDKFTDKSTDKLTGKSTDKLTGKSTDKLTGKSIDKLTGNTTDKLTGKSTDKLTGKSTDKLTGKSTDKVTDKTTHKLSEAKLRRTSVDDDAEDPLFQSAIERALSHRADD